MLPDKELNLDGMVPPPLVKLHELLKLHLKHYRNLAQFRRRTSESLLCRERFTAFTMVS